MFGKAVVEKPLVVGRWCDWSRTALPVQPCWDRHGVSASRAGGRCQLWSVFGAGNAAVPRALLPVLPRGPGGRSRAPAALEREFSASEPRSEERQPRGASGTGARHREAAPSASPAPRTKAAQCAMGGIYRRLLTDKGLPGRPWVCRHLQSGSSVFQQHVLSFK